jgi:cell division protein FtsX
MPTDFRTEMGAWREVFGLRKRTLVFFEALLLGLVMAFFVSVWQLQLFSAQFVQLTGQVEIVTEINEGLPQSEIDLLQGELEKLSGVEDIQYWDTAQVSEYIDQRLFRGYGDFVEKYQLDLPVRPLFRLKLSDISVRNDVLEELRGRFSSQLLVVDGPSIENADSFGFQFVESLRNSIWHLQVLVVCLFLIIIGFSGYMTSFLLSERSRGFHLSQMLHLSLPYTFWPAVWVAFRMSAFVTLIALILSVLLFGEWLLVLAGMLLAAFVLIDIILVWFGRFVVVKWGMR